MYVYNDSQSNIKYSFNSSVICYIFWHVANTKSVMWSLTAVSPSQQDNSVIKCQTNKMCTTMVN
jgi:hypothetical protein